jgi:adenylate cyclase
MSAAPEDRGLSVGYKTSIIGLFAAIVLFVGLTLVYLSFERVSAMTQSAAITFIDQVAQRTADRIETQFKDVSDRLEILKQVPSVQAAEVVGSPRLYALMAAMLRNNEHLYNLYAGYEDGSFVELDAINRSAARAKLGAPEGAVFRLVTISKSGIGLIRAASFLTEDLTVLTRTPTAADYDPRQRPWYIGAFEPNASALTDPYIFYATGEPGYTLRAAIPQGQRGVVAGDVLLDEAEALLRKQELGQSGLVFLFDDSGRIIVHPHMAELLNAQSTERGIDELPLLRTADDTGVAAAIQKWENGGAPQQIFRGTDGRTYAAAFRSIETAGSAKLRLVVLAPLAEFFATIFAERRMLFILALGLVAGMLPIVFWVGSLLSRSLQQLAAETDRIQRFEMSNAPPIRSSIREIHELGRSVHTMRNVVQTFSNFVPKRLVQQLIETQTPMKLGGARREVTVLFTDVADFTAITERADPERVMVYTSRYFAALTEAIMAAKGTVDKFIGDAVMAIWNAPADDPNHVLNACTAVLACLDANRALNLEFEREGWPAYRTRFGLHVGDAVVGNIGSADRMNYTALGATINLAARLEGLNKNYGTAVLVSEAIKNRAEAGFVFRSVDRISPKGFAASFTVFELRGKQGTGSDAALYQEWEDIYASLWAETPQKTLLKLKIFLTQYPEDSVAAYHLRRIDRS